jgi:hypothetical protein
MIPSPAARSAPAAARNRDPILQVLRDYLPMPASVLEIASGSGEHAVWFSRALPLATWQPSDRDAGAMASIAAWQEASDLPNLRPPVTLDASDPDSWPIDRADAIVAINMIHISPWAATEGLLAGADRILPPEGLLFCYGPFRVNGAHTAPSNAAFDADLRARNPEWGIRDLSDIAALAVRNDLVLAERIAMPANNFTLIFRRSPTAR